jgi:hypothetical protein
MLFRKNLTRIQTPSSNEKFFPKSNLFCPVSRDSSVGIATGYGMDDHGGGSLGPGRVNNFHFSMSSRPALGSYKMGPGVKAAGA